MKPTAASHLNNLNGKMGRCGKLFPGVSFLHRLTKPSKLHRNMFHKKRCKDQLWTLLTWFHLSSTLPSGSFLPISLANSTPGNVYPSQTYRMVGKWNHHNHSTISTSRSWQLHPSAVTKSLAVSSGLITAEPEGWFRYIPINSYWAPGLSQFLADP